MIKEVTKTSKPLDIPAFMISGNQYETPIFYCNQKGNMSIAWRNIQGLTKPILKADSLNFKLKFPFNEARSYTIYPAEKGFTRQSIIDSIRRHYRHLFRHSKEVAYQWETSLNGCEVTQYQVLYPFSNLFVDRVFYDKSNDELIIRVDGTPVSNDSLDLPF